MYYQSLKIFKSKTLTLPSSPLMDLAVSKKPGTWLGTSSRLKYHTYNTKGYSKTIYYTMKILIHYAGERKKTCKLMWKMSVCS